MAFAARQHDDKTWRLCLRKGRTFLTADRIPIQFSSQAKAKACADALNEQFWERNKKAIQAETRPPDAVGMLQLIQEFCQ